MTNRFIFNDAAAARSSIQRILADLEGAAATGFRSPPAEPTTCCGRGCNGCVWESYFAAVGWWCEDAGLFLEKASSLAGHRSAG